MTTIRVSSTAGRLIFGGLDIPCAIGRSGSCPASAKQEGDGCTPLGRWPVRGALLRPGRVALNSPLAIPWRRTRTHAGCCAGFEDRAYHPPVRLPRRPPPDPFQRDDEAYAITIALGSDADPPDPRAGNATL